MSDAKINIRVFSVAGPQDALQSLAADFERATEHRVKLTFALVTEILQSLVAGETVDLILLPAPLIDAAEETVPLRAEGRKVFARVGIGVIVRQGAAKSDISSEESVRRALLDARSIVLDNPNTPNGEYLEQMKTRLGIAEEVGPKVVAKAPVEGGAEMVAKGQADLGLFLASEVRNVEGAIL